MLTYYSVFKPIYKIFYKLTYGITSQISTKKRTSNARPLKFPRLYFKLKPSSDSLIKSTNQM